jgi:fumarylacetoacetase
MPADSWLPAVSQFCAENLPLGVVSPHWSRRPRCATRLGETVIDLSVLEEAGLFADILGDQVFSKTTLNAYLQHEAAVWLAVRLRLQDLLCVSEGEQEGEEEAVQEGENDAAEAAASNDASSNGATSNGATDVSAAMSNSAANDNVNTDNSAATDNPTTATDNPTTDAAATNKDSTIPNSNTKTDNKVCRVKDDRLYKNKLLQKASFYRLDEVTMHLPIQIGDYTDFYASRQHATHVGTLFRGPQNALPDNWLHLPIGYHGRSSTVAVSPQTLPRPCGQIQGTQGPVYAPSDKLDFELEVGAVVGGPCNTGPMSLAQATDRIFGYVLLNDWSARDIQRWEYVPLGPFTSKNFATTISPWIITRLALEEYAEATNLSADDPVPLDYLLDKDNPQVVYNVDLTVSLKTDSMQNASVICKTNLRNMYWSAAQQLVHHSVTGCIMRPGDLLGSGTISSAECEGASGSLLELSNNGDKPIALADSSETRSFLQDGDVVIMSGVCPGGRVGFGECVGTIVPSVKPGTKQASDASKDVRFCNFTLYKDDLSPMATWRIKIALELKRVEYKIESKTEEMKKRNHHQPILQCTDTAVNNETVQISQLLGIMNLLDQIYPDRPSLIPHGVLDRVYSFELYQQLVTELQSHLTVTDLEKKLPLVAKQVEYFRVHTRVAGPYCVGTFAPTLADVALSSLLYRARRVHMANLLNDLCPSLVKIDETFRAEYPHLFAT